MGSRSQVSNKCQIIPSRNAIPSRSLLNQNGQQQQQQQQQIHQELVSNLDSWAPPNLWNPSRNTMEKPGEFHAC